VSAKQFWGELLNEGVSGLEESGALSFLGVAEDFSYTLRTTNPNFKRDRFLAACGVEYVWDIGYRIRLSQVIAIPAPVQPQPSLCYPDRHRRTDEVSTSEPMVRRIVQAAYPSYRGRKVSIVPQRYPPNVRSYWEGGSRDYFVFLRLDTLAVAASPERIRQTGAMCHAVTLPLGIVCVEHSIFCGKDTGIRIQPTTVENLPFLAVGTMTLSLRHEENNQPQGTRCPLPDLRRCADAEIRA
jgi:hypothetical protein